MEITYRRDLKNHYMILHGTREISPDAYQIRMIQENRIDGFAACHTEQIDEEVRCFYQITSMQSLLEVLEIRPAGTELLRMLLTSLADALRALDAYLLSQDGVVLMPECIFVNMSERRCYFCYLPGHEIPVGDGVRELAEYLLPHLDEKDRAAVMLGFSFYQSCTSGDLTEKKLLELLYGDGTLPDAEEGDCGNTARYVPGAKQSDQIRSNYTTGQSDHEQEAREAERARILDAFFSDEEEQELAAACRKRRTLIWFLMTGLAGAGAAAGFAVAGWRQTGLGTAVLIEAMAILLWKKQDSIRRWRAGLAAHLRGKNADEELVELTGQGWLTYEERADELEEEKRFRHQAGGADESPERMRFLQETDAGCEETIWLDDVEAEAGHKDRCAFLWEERGALHGAGKRILLTEERYMIGKSRKDCDIVTDSSAVSRIHARLSRTKDGYAITDLRSKNGSFINEERLEAGREYLLREEDRIRLADVIYRYEIPGGTSSGSR